MNAVDSQVRSCRSEDQGGELRRGRTADQRQHRVVDDDAAIIIDALETAVEDVKAVEAPLIITRLAGLQSRIAARLMAAASAPVESNERLTLLELAERLRMGTSTIRAMVASGRFREGEHFTRNGRKLIFLWNEVQVRLQQMARLREAQKPEIVPFYRRGRRGHEKTKAA
jgi:hypothetical protein